MMSQEHQLPGDGEETGGDEEEGDREARTAVAALLALTLPTDYNYSSYDDTYLMETSEDDYTTKDAKCIPDYDEEEVDESGIHMIQESGDGGLCPTELKEDVGDDYTPLVCQESDDGLAHLRAYVQEETEVKGDNGTEEPQEMAPHVNQSLQEQRDVSVFSLPQVKDTKKEDFFATPNPKVSQELNTASSVPELSPLKDYGKVSSSVPKVTKQRDLESAQEKTSFTSSSKKFKQEIFTDTNIPLSQGVHDVTGKYESETGIKMPTGNTSLPRIGFAKDFSKRKICSTLDDSDTSSDSSSDSDSDSDSSSSSSSDSDDGSDSDSDSDSSSSKEDKREDLGKVDSISSKNERPMPSLDFFGNDKNLLKATSQLNEGKNAYLSRDVGESMKLKSPPLLKDEVNLSSDAVRQTHIDKEKEGVGKPHVKRERSLQEKGSAKKGTALEKYIKKESIFEEETVRKEGPVYEKTSLKREPNAGDKYKGTEKEKSMSQLPNRKEGHGPEISLVKKEGSVQEDSVKKDGCDPEKSPTKREKTIPIKLEKGGNKFDRNLPKEEEDYSDTTPERKGSHYVSKDGNVSDLTKKSRDCQKKETGVHLKSLKRDGSLGDNTDRREENFCENTENKCLSFLEKIEARDVSSGGKDEKQDGNVIEKIERKEESILGKIEKVEGQSQEKTGIKMEKSGLKQALDKGKEIMQEKISPKREGSVQTYSQLLKIPKIVDKAKYMYDTKSGEGKGKIDSESEEGKEKIDLKTGVGKGKIDSKSKEGKDKIDLKTGEGKSKMNSNKSGEGNGKMNFKSGEGKGKINTKSEEGRDKIDSKCGEGKVKSLNSDENRVNWECSPSKTESKNDALEVTREKFKSEPPKRKIAPVKTEKDEQKGMAELEKETKITKSNCKEDVQNCSGSLKPSSSKGRKDSEASPPKTIKSSKKGNSKKEELAKQTDASLKISLKTNKTTSNKDSSKDMALSEPRMSQKQAASPLLKKKKSSNHSSHQESSNEASQTVNQQQKRDDAEDVKKCPREVVSCRKDSTHSQNSKVSSDDAVLKDSAPDTSPNKDDDRFDSEIDDMLPMPIQAEVVMSEGSESGIEYGEYDKNLNDDNATHLLKTTEEILQQSDKENSELVAYLQSFVTGGGKGEVVEYPPPNNELPAEGTDLTQWQLDGVHLPPFTPNVAPPSWLRLTIPAEGYRCHSCGDIFFIESSLVQHRERRSVWISLECGPCDAKLTFYNRCALKDHLRMHLLRGEEVDEETVDVRSLPLQLTRLLQPILVPVPQSLMVGSTCISYSTSKLHSSVTKLPALKPIGKGTAKHVSEKLSNGTSEENYTSEDYNADEEGHISPEKIPLGMKRLSPRRRTIRCYLCERMFHSVRELMAHMRTDQPYSDQRVECRKCQLVLPSVCAAKAHILTHPPANTSNVSVCPECGSRCDGPRDFVHHLNTCGHQFRRSGVVCTICQVCFFKSQEDFLTHWILEHCGKSYECVVCQNTFESLVFHNCQSPGQQVLATFRCLLTCPMCSESVQLNAQEESDANTKVETHLADCHPSIITRVHYVYKSKFCTNAFRSKDELRAHHDREHRRDNHYRTKTCTLHHEVLMYQHQYFNGQEPRNAFVTLPVALSAEELHEARIRDVPTVSSVIDKTLFPDMPSLDSSKLNKSERQSKTKNTMKLNFSKEAELNDVSSLESPTKKDTDLLEKLKPVACYRCGYKFTEGKDFRRHKRSCEGESRERRCEVCSWTGIGEDFAKHCRGHLQENYIICIYCNGTQFDSCTDLEQHFELHVHEQFLYPANCAFCSTILPDVSSALTHLGEEHDPLHVQFDNSEFECNQCGRHFHGERGLSVHLGRCTIGVANPASSSTGCRQCKVCTKALTPEMFGRHMVSHLEEGLLVCSLCDGRTLPSSMALLHHLEEHAAALAYPTLCPMCNFSMVDSTSSLIHMKEEHGFGNLLCDDCDMRYSFTYQLQRHIDIVHKICLYAKRRYICWICRAYDHVKKETLMNHFRTVHGLVREQVDEKVMIRTRGQGTKPTSQFIPTKPLGSKEVPSTTSPSKGAGENSVPKSQKEKSKTSPSKSSITSPESSRHIVKSPQQSKSLPSTPGKGTGGSPSNPNKVNVKEKGESKLNDKTKVLIKRLPDSVLDDHSRSKKRKIPEDKRLIKKHKSKKKPKLYRCSTCGFGTNNKEKHDNHILKHKGVVQDSEPDDYVCTECGASFVVEPSLARHMFFAHKVKLPVTSADEDESSTVLQDGDAPVSIDSDTNKDIPVPVRSPSIDPVLSENLQEKLDTTSIKDKIIDDNRKDEGTESRRKLSSETKKRKVKSEARPVSANKTSVKVKKKKISTVNAGEKTKEGKDFMVVKEESAVVNESIKQEKVIENHDSKEVCESVAKRKPTRISVQKKSEKNPLDDTSPVNKTTTKKKVKKDVKKKSVGIKNLVGSKKSLIITPKKIDNVIKKTKKKNSDKISLKKRKKGNLDVGCDDHCVVCKEKFTNPVELYSHLRTHGMAFLKLGRKARPQGGEGQKGS